MTLLEVCSSDRINLRDLLLCLRRESVGRSLFGNYPLITMAKNPYSKPQHLRLLLENGADPNARDIYGLTALYYLYSRDEDLSKIRTLISFGAVL